MNVRPLGVPKGGLLLPELDLCEPDTELAQVNRAISVPVHGDVAGLRVVQIDIKQVNIGQELFLGKFSCKESTQLNTNKYLSVPVYWSKLILLLVYMEWYTVCVGIHALENIPAVIVEQLVLDEEACLKSTHKLNEV